MHTSAAPDDRGSTNSHPIARTGTRVGVLAGIVALVAMGAAGCGRAVAAGEPSVRAPETFVVTEPVVMDVPVRATHVAEVHAVQHIEVKARVSGWLERIEVDEGDVVEAGRVLFVVDAREPQIELQRAQASRAVAAAEVVKAEIEARKRRELAAKDVVAAQEVDLAEAALAAAQAGLAQAVAAVSAAELAVQHTRILAPFAGRVDRLRHKVGSYVEAGAVLTTLSDDSEVFAYFRLSERSFLARSATGLTAGVEAPEQVEFERADGAQHGQPGRIDVTGSVVDAGTGAVSCRARFANKGRILRHGATGRVVLTSTRKDALVVPKRSTFERQQNVCVFVVGESGQLVARQVVIDLRLEDHFVVASGLRPGDRVLFEGARLVREGTVIAPMFRPMREIAPL